MWPPMLPEQTSQKTWQIHSQTPEQKRPDKSSDTHVCTVVTVLPVAGQTWGNNFHET